MYRIKANERIWGSGREADAKSVGHAEGVYFFACSKEEITEIKKELNLYGENSGAQINCEKFKLIDLIKGAEEVRAVSLQEGIEAL